MVFRSAGLSGEDVRAPSAVEREVKNVSVSRCFEVPASQQCLGNISLGLSHESLLDRPPRSGESTQAPAGNIYRYTGDDSRPWVRIPGALTDIGAAADGTVWGVNANNDIFRYTGDSNYWIKFPVHSNESLLDRAPMSGESMLVATYIVTPIMTASPGFESLAP
ncbi:hypothetical protein C8J57DRAFT_1678972 [Mycena rebaudengoi]|nr:hypothetical protein C8J57DRAFT_1678972 [Mycena rebaudengoi]